MQDAGQVQAHCGASMHIEQTQLAQPPIFLCLVVPVSVVFADFSPLSSLAYFFSFFFQKRKMNEPKLSISVLLCCSNRVFHDESQVIVVLTERTPVAAFRCANAHWCSTVSFWGWRRLRDSFKRLLNCSHDTWCMCAQWGQHTSTS